MQMETRIHGLELPLSWTGLFWLFGASRKLPYEKLSRTLFPYPFMPIFPCLPAPLHMGDLSASRTCGERAPPRLGTIDVKVRSPITSRYAAVSVRILAPRSLCMRLPRLQARAGFAAWVRSLGSVSCWCTTLSVVVPGLLRACWPIRVS